MENQEPLISLPLEPGVRSYLQKVCEELAHTVEDFTCPRQTPAINAALRQLNSVRATLNELIHYDDLAFEAAFCAENALHSKAHHSVSITTTKKGLDDGQNP